MLSRLLRLLDTPLGRAARYALSAGLLAWFIWRIDWRQLAGATDKFAAGPAVLALLLIGSTYPIHAWRWWLLLRAQGLRLSFRWTRAVTWICQFYNAFLLGGLGGDAARVFYICRDQPERRAAGIVTIFIDRVMGLTALMSLALLALLAKFGAVARDDRLRWVFVGTVTVTLGAMVGAWIALRLDPARWPRWVRHAIGEARLDELAKMIALTRAAPREHLLGLASGYVIWLFEFIGTWLLARSVGLPLPFLETCIATSVAYAVTGLPISVGGHGVREGALLFTLGLFGLVPADGAGHDRALLLALMVGACTIFWSLFGGLIVLGARRLVPPPLPPASPAR